MGERKVLNKYYPPDFNPAMIPRRSQPKNQQIVVRMMLSMSVRCSTCGNYIYRGTKFNSRKEDVTGETYLGIQIFRFYFKCTKCSAEITFKNDPQNNDYVVESGAPRNFEPWHMEDEEIQEEKRKRNAEEMGDTMKTLENRTLDSKREMDLLATLDEMRSLKSRHATVSVDAMLEGLQRSDKEKEQKLEEEDEALIKSVFKGQREVAVLRRINDEDIDSDDEDLTLFLPNNEGTFAGPSKVKLGEMYVTNILVIESANKRDNVGFYGASGNGKLNSKSCSVKVSALKKSDAESRDVSSSGLQSLCKQYESDEENEQ